jgi:hypothetical protein
MTFLQPSHISAPPFFQFHSSCSHSCGLNRVKATSLSLFAAWKQARLEIPTYSCIDDGVDSDLSIPNARCYLGDMTDIAAGAIGGPDVGFEVRFDGFSGVDVGIGGGTVLAGCG